MLVYRASRRACTDFDPLDSSASIARDGWRFNDRYSEILYAAEVQSLSILEVVAWPGWHTMPELTVAAIEVPNGTVLNLKDLGITLPTNWNVRPAGPNARSIGAEFLAAVDREAAKGRQVCGVRVPSVISTVDCNVLLDPRQKTEFSIASRERIPFDWLMDTAT